MKGNEGERRITRALRHPIRREILRWMDGQVDASSPRLISDHLGYPLPNLSYHVRVLRDAGLLDATEQVSKRGSIEHFYRLNTEAVKAPAVSQVLRATAQRGR